MGFENTYEKVGRVFPKRVRFTGTTALLKGQGVCYDADRGTATDSDAKRQRYVELPSITNSRHFAGVASQGYSAKSAGQWIEIYEPGSVCEVAIGVDTVVDSTMMTCSCNGVDAGRFTFEGFPGRGTALALQTNASGVLASSYDGTGALNAAGLVITDTAAFAGLTAGTTYDIYVTAGEDDATDACVGLKTTGTYTTDDTFTLAATASDGTSSTLTVSYYIQAGNQRCLAYLFDGEESGLQQIYQITNGANTGLMDWGFTYIHGTFVPSADATETLPAGTRIGQKVGIKLLSDLTTNDYLLTVTTGVQLDGTTALATAEFDGANDFSVLEWTGIHWKLISNSGTALA